MKATAIITSLFLTASIAFAQLTGHVNNRATHIVKLKSAMNTTTGKKKTIYICINIIITYR